MSPLHNRLADRPVLVSWSAWQRFQDCPLREGLWRAGTPRLPKDRRNFIVGDVVHEALEWVAHHRQVPPAEYVSAWFQHEAEKGVAWKGEGDALRLVTYAWGAVNQIGSWLAQLLRHADDVAVEQEYVSWRELYPDMPEADSRYGMTAKTDLLVLLPDRTMLVIDYKSGLRARTIDGQANWYFEVLADVFPDHPLRFFQVNPGTAGLVRKEVPLDPDGLQEAALRAEGLAGAIFEGSFPAHPEMARCQWCRARPGCAESAYKPARGRTAV